MGILIVDSLTDPCTGLSNTNTYASFQKSTVKVRYNDVTGLYNAFGVANLWWSMTARLNDGNTAGCSNKIKAYAITTPTYTLSQFNDIGLYTILYTQLKLELDFSGKEVQDVPHLIFGLPTANQLPITTIHIPQSLEISDSTNPEYIITLPYTVLNGFNDSVLGEDPTVTFAEIFSSDGLTNVNLQFQNMNLDLESTITTGVTSTARVITEVGGPGMGIPFSMTPPMFLNTGDTHTANMTIRLTSVNPNKTNDYTFTITSDFLPFTSYC